MQYRRFAMRLPTLFTVIIVATATAASAEPKQEEISGRVSLNEKSDKKTDAPRQPGDWVEIASPTPAKHGTEFVIVGKEAGSFSKLRVEGAKGKTIVRRVKVVFADGKTKSVQVDKSLARGKSAFVDLGDPKLIDRIVVTTETHTSGAYAIYGTAGGGVVGSR
jgi:hypothetical protein